MHVIIVGSIDYQSNFLYGIPVIEANVNLILTHGVFIDCNLYQEDVMTYLVKAGDG